MSTPEPGADRSVLGLWNLRIRHHAGRAFGRESRSSSKNTARFKKLFGPEQFYSKNFALRDILCVFISGMGRKESLSAWLFHLG